MELPCEACQRQTARLVFRIMFAPRLAILLCWLVLAGAAAARSAPLPTASEYVVTTWQMDEGLPQNTVTAVTQTRDGYLWLGTQNGLVRFDGVRFTLFDSRNVPALANSRVVKLQEDRAGSLWIGTEEAGLVCFRDGEFTAYHPPNRGTTPSYARAMCYDAGGALWLASCESQLIRFDGAAFAVMSDGWPLRGPEASALTTDAAGGVWVGTARELATWRNGRFETVRDDEQEPGFGVHYLAAARAGGCWVAAGDRLRRFLKAGWVEDRGAFARTNRPIYDLFEDTRSQLWVATMGGGLLRYSTNGVVLALTKQSGLPTDFVRCVTEDREGNLWVGTEGCGLFRLRPRLFETLGRADGLASDHVRSVSEPEPGEVWIGTNGDGLDCLKDGRIEHFGPSQGLDNGHVWAVLRDRRGVVWAGTWGGLYTRANGRFTGMGDGRGFSSATLALYEDSGGGLWVGQQAFPAVTRMREGQSTMLRLPGTTASHDVRAIAEDQHGGLWFGTVGEGLYRWHQGGFTHWTTTDGLRSMAIWCLYADREGTLWIGTERGGLSWWRGGRLYTCTTREGMVNDVICQILEDDAGNLWLGSHGGVFRVSKAQLHQIAADGARRVDCLSFTRADGLPSIECSGGSQPSGWRTRDGRLWFPTVRGLAVLDPSKVTHNPLAPPVVIEDALLEPSKRQTVAALNRSPAPALQRFGLGTPPLVLPAGTSQLEFRFTALSFSAPEKVRFKYRLEGLETDWVDGGARRTANYSFLAPGRYRFRVTACNNDGVWNETGALLALVIQPYFWQTGWFQSGLLAGVVASAAGIARHFSRRQLQQKLERVEREGAVERERARIAKDIHDDLGSSLTRIALLSELTSADKERPAEIEAHAKKIATSARETVRSLDEIVWAVNPHNDTLNGLAVYLTHFADEFFGGTPVSCRLELPSDLPHRALASELRHNLFLAVKEASHNILKHAMATEAWIGMRVEDSTLTVHVADNGCGFEPTQPRPRVGNGLINMERRLQAVGGVCRVTSAPGKGTTVRFTLPLR